MSTEENEKHAAQLMEPVFKGMEETTGHAIGCGCPQCRPDMNESGEKLQACTKGHTWYDSQTKANRLCDPCDCPKITCRPDLWKMKEAVNDKARERVPHLHNCPCGMCIPNKDNRRRPAPTPRHPVGAKECCCPQCCPANYRWHDKQTQEELFAYWDDEEEARRLNTIVTRDDRIKQRDKDVTHPKGCMCLACITNRDQDRHRQVQRAEAKWADDALKVQLCDIDKTVNSLREQLSKLHSVSFSENGEKGITKEKSMG